MSNDSLPHSESPMVDTHPSDAAGAISIPNPASAPQSWPILDPRGLPGVVRDIIQAACAHSEADPVAVLTSVLTWFGASFGPQPHVLVGHTKHCARLFCVKVGATSRARKGTSEGPVKDVFRAAEALERGEAGLLPLTESPGPLSTGEGLIHVVRDPRDDRDEDGVPFDQGVADKRLIVIDGELAAPLKSAQRDGNILSPVMRTIWDSGTIAPLTKTHPIKVTGAHVCLIGHITIQELVQLLQKADIWNGFANRMLWMCVRRPKLVPMPRGIDERTLATLACRVRKIIDHARTINRVDWSSAATQDWCALYPSVSVDEDGAFGAVTARAEAQLIRLALIVALIDESRLIQPHHLIAAAAVWEYARASARLIFGGQSENVIQSRILAVLREGPRTTTDINVAFGGHLPSAQLRQVLGTLQASGRISAEQQRTSGRSVTYWSIVAANAATADAPSVAVPAESLAALSAKSASSAEGEQDSLVDRLERMSAERASEQLRSMGLGPR